MLYLPVKRFFSDLGYEVRSEVNGRDLVAVMDESVVVVELKRSFNLSLLLQGVERQKSADHVFLAVEAPKRRSRRWNQIRSLCRRLGLGLLFVSFPKKRPARVELVCEPEMPIGVTTRRKERAKLLQEFAGRSGDYNIGGSTRLPIVTAYRETALHLASCLRACGEPQRVKDLRDQSGCERAGRILQDNYYGWFERVSRGVYRLTPEGEEALVQYAEVVKGWERDSEGAHNGSHHTGEV